MVMIQPTEAGGRPKESAKKVMATPVNAAQSLRDFSFAIMVFYGVK